MYKLTKNVQSIICLLLISMIWTLCFTDFAFAHSWVADIDNGMDNLFEVLNQNPENSVYFPVPQAVEYEGKLYLTWVEENSSGITQIRVSEYDGADWTIIDGDGENSLNFNPTQDYLSEPSITVSNGVLYVSWYEWSETNPNGYFSHISKYNGTPGSWTRIDGGTGYGIRYNNTIDGATYFKAGNLKLIDYNNKLYAAWSEKANGQSGSSVVLASYDGTSWSNISSKLNTAVEGLFPNMSVHNGDLYITFEEGENNNTNSANNICVKKYNSSTGISDVTSNTPLDYNTSYGCDHKTKLVSDGTSLYAIWNEINSGGKTQIRAKKYNGSDWTSIDGGGTTGLNYNSSESAYITSLTEYAGDIYVSWYEQNGTQFDQMRIKKYDPDTSSWTFVDDNGLTNGSGFSYGLNMYPEEYGVSSSCLAEYNSELYLFWRENNKLYVKKHDSAWVISADAANLSSLQISSGNLYPVFDGDTKNYTVLVDNSVESVNVTPEVFEQNATITVNGVACTSGSPSQEIALDVGSNDVIIWVTSHRGVLLKKYVVKFVRYTVDGKILITPTEDVCLYEDTLSDPYTIYNYGTDAANFVGYSSSESANNHSFEKFDYSFLQGGTITNAAFKIYVPTYDDTYNRAGLIGNPRFDLYYSNDDTWDETALTLPPNAGDIVSDITMTAGVTTTNAYYAFNQAQLLNAINSCEDKIITLVLEGDIAGDGTLIFSSDDSLTNKPILELTYVQASKAITEFKFAGLIPEVIGVVDEGNKTIALTVPYGTDVTELVPTITHTGASISPNTGVAQNFTNPVTYTVTAENATTQEYIVTVTKAANPAKAITGFNFAGLSPEVIGVVDEGNKTIALTVPYGTDVTELVPTITHTGASISPNTGAAKDFTSPVTYTVTAANATTQEYVVTVTEAANPAKAITAFKFAGLIPEVIGVVDEGNKTIALTVPYGTDVTKLVPAITHTGASISPNTGVAKDFTNPVTYKVTAANATTQEYVVIVTEAANPVKAITAFNFAGLIPEVIGVVDEGNKTIALTVPYGTDVTELVPTITHTGASISPNTGAAKDFTSPVTYTVTAANTTTQEYVVTVTEAANPAKAITAFNFAGLSPEVTGVVNEGNKTIALTVPYGTDVTELVPTITHTGASISPNTGVAKDFTSPVTYTVTAANATTQEYVVTVTEAANPTKAITGFKFAGLSPEVTGVVDEGNKTIALTVPYETDVTELVPTITHTGTSISPDIGVAQDFTNPVTYTVTAANATTQEYVVTVTKAANPAKAITEFKFEGLSTTVTGVVYEQSKTITLTVPYGTDVTALVPTITYTGTSISPNTGVAQDFTNSVTYTVTAANATTQEYVVSVIITSDTSKAITAFKFEGLSTEVIGVVDEGNKTIALTVPYETDMTALVPTITHTGASISPDTGVAQDFTNPVTYTVTAANATTQEYVVTVTKAANPAKAITAFKFAGLSPVVTGIVDEGKKTIALTVPYGTDITALVPAITYTGASISPNTGVAKNFTNPVTYTVTAANATTQEYVVTVAIASKPESKGSSKSNNNSSTTTTTATTTETVVIINGKEQNAGTTITAIVENQTVTTVSIDDKKVEEKLNKEGNGATVIIPVKTASDVVVGQLNGQTVKNMEQKEAVLEIKTSNVSYTIPASEINIDAISLQIGEQVALKDIKINVSISEPVKDTVKIVENIASKNKYQIVVKPIDFTITCSSDKKTVEVSKFNSYVERMVEIPNGVDTSKITTGIVLNADGSFSHVPTKVMIIDGKHYAKINSLTNSTYSIIYNPKLFTDVEKHWAKDDVNDMGSRLIIKGIDDANFDPDREITRAEFAAVIIKALGIKPESRSNLFSDVKDSDWSSEYISAAYSNNIIKGYTDGSFKPNGKITREEAMAMIAQAMKITKLKSALNKGQEGNALLKFNDNSSISSWANLFVVDCVNTGIVKGRNSIMAPKENITRAETAVIVKRLLEQSDLI